MRGACAGWKRMPVDWMGQPGWKGEAGLKGKACRTGVKTNPKEVLPITAGP